MVALLKQKSKVNITMKPRKTYEIANVLKRKRDSSSLVGQTIKPTGCQTNSGSRGSNIQVNINPDLLKPK